MRKGAWLNRPVQINQKPATNKYDVMVAIANAVPKALAVIPQDDSISSDITRDKLIASLTQELGK